MRLHASPAAIKTEIEIGLQIQTQTARMELLMLDSRRTDLQIVDLLYWADFGDLIVAIIVHIQYDLASSTSFHSFIRFYVRLCWFLVYSIGIFSEE